jgi:FAD/FMN-containing dehydrogenase
VSVKADPAIDALRRELLVLLGSSDVLTQSEDLVLYEYDGSVEKGRPDVVVFPRTTEQVSDIVKLAARHEVPIVGRGAGTGLSGGALARSGGVMIAFSRMNRILYVDTDSRRAVVQPGVVNQDITRVVEDAGLYFAPDPSSQKACTIGGNVAENAGGPHTLAYGVTANHIVALELVLPDGEIVRIGNEHGDPQGYDLCGLLVGSEGTLALITEITVKLSREAEAVKTLLAIFDTVDDASQTVAEITARGIIPTACSMAGRCVWLKTTLTRDFRETVQRSYFWKSKACARPSRYKLPRLKKYAAKITREKFEWHAMIRNATCSGKAAKTLSVRSVASPQATTCSTVSSRDPSSRKRCDTFRKSAKNMGFTLAIFFMPAMAISIPS